MSHEKLIFNRIDRDVTCKVFTGILLWLRASAHDIIILDLECITFRSGALIDCYIYHKSCIYTADLVRKNSSMARLEEE